MKLDDDINIPMEKDDTHMHTHTHTTVQQALCTSSLVLLDVLTHV